MDPIKMTLIPPAPRFTAILPYDQNHSKMHISLCCRIWLWYARPKRNVPFWMVFIIWENWSHGKMCGRGLLLVLKIWTICFSYWGLFNRFCLLIFQGIDVKSMGRIFIGLVKCGAWGCFDEFNRLETAVLSAVSMQIQVIQDAIKARAQSIELLGRNVSSQVLPE